MPKIIVCRGIQGSGKSTWSRKWAEEDPENRVRFNNDDIRKMCGKYWVPKREGFIGQIKEQFLYEAMFRSYDVVIDNLNLNPKEIEWITNMVADHNRYVSHGDYTPQDIYEIEFQDFKTPLEECIRRDALRENPIGAEVITNTYNRYKLFYEENQESVREDT